MFNQLGETHTRKLIKKYEQFKAEGVPEEEIIEKSVAAVGSERQPTESVKKPETMTPNVLAEANLKNIFKD